MNMIRNKGLLGVVAISLACAFSAGCDDDEDDLVGEPAAFVDLDLNADGVIAPDEWAAINAALDVNLDGVIDENEFLLADGFSDLDVNEDNALSDAEFAAATQTWDIDGDGLLAEPEIDPFFF
jgi:hypothetical protein